SQVQEAGKVPRQLFWSGDKQQLRQRLPNSQAFVIDEKERAVLNDRTAECCAKLVLLIGLPAKEIKGVTSVELIVAEELVCVAVELISPRFYDRIHDRAVAAPEFSAIGVGLHLEFANGIHRWLNHISAAIEHVTEVGVIIDAIQEIIVLQCPRTV